MFDLLIVQRDLAAALRDAGHTAQAAQWLAGDGALAERRLAIYRGNILASITKALVAAYPVVQRVVGEEFFEALARTHLQASPSVSGDLYDYGANVPEFVESFPHTQALPYLADLARLEWAVHRAYGAQDAMPLDLATLHQTAPERQSALRFICAPGAACIVSAHPIVRIWRIHQADHVGEFSVDWSASESALVMREDLRVTVSALAAGDTAFVKSALEGAMLGQATEAAFAADAEFDLRRCLTGAIESGLIRGFTF